MSKEIYHNESACKALVEYEKQARLVDLTGIRGNSMQYYANINGTTIPEMKQHWNCVEKIIGKDPYENFPNHLLQAGLRPKQ